MTSPRIVVVGSYATGLTMKLERLPHTGETLLGTGYRVNCGGKGSNQAVGCARLGAQVAFVAKIGKDAFGEMALRLYRDEGIDVEWVGLASGSPTGVGFILVESSTGKNCIALDPGANELLTRDEVARCDAAFDSAGVVLTQLEISAEAAGEAMARGREHGAITILNPAPVRSLPAGVFPNVDILTPNEVEARVLAGLPPDAHVEPAEVARELMRRGVKQVVMTLGERGALIVSPTTATLIPAISVAAVDTTGAGDAFNAGLATALTKGAALGEAVQFAVIAGGLAVTKEGVVPSLPRLGEVVAYARKLGLPLETLDGIP